MEPKLPFALCDECPLKDEPLVPPCGSRTPKLILVGEAPGAEEVRQGRPFVGRAGKLLAAVLAGVGIGDGDVWLTNAVMCRPPGNARPSEEAIDCCNERMWKELRSLGQHKIVALGNAAVDAVINGSGAISVIRGAWYQKGQYRVLPTWHPAYILRSPEDAAELIRDIEKAAHPARIAPIDLEDPPEVVWLNTPEEIQKVVGDWYARDVAFDFEANQVDWLREPALMLGLAVDYNRGYIIPEEMLYDSPAATDILNSMAKRNCLVGHNAKFDLHFANKLGLTEFAGAVAFDTILAHYALDERKGGHGLKKLAREYFDVKDYDHILVHRYLRSRNDDWSNVPPDSLAKYLALDVTLTLALKRQLWAELTAEGLRTYPFENVLMKAHDLAFNMEELGMQIDMEHLEHWQGILEQVREYYLAELRRISGHPELNPRSALQVSRIVWDERKLKHPPKQTWDKVKGQVNLNPRSTSEVALFHLAKVEAGEVKGFDDEFLDILFKYRRVSKILSTYLEPILEKVDEDGRYHDDIKIFGTETGRLATFLHTIPRETTDIYGRIIRSAFMAAPGYMFVNVDYSQAELRAAAALSKEPFLIDVYARDGDVHTEVTRAVFGPNAGKEQRIIIKRYNFAYIYGGGMAALVSDTNIPKDKAHAIMRDYESKMQQLAKWKRETQAHMIDFGYVQSPFGRRRRFPYINDSNHTEALKSAVNSPIQSTAADLTTLSAYRAMKEGYRVLLTKHDEVIVEVPAQDAQKHAERIKTIMEETGAEFFPEVKWKADYELRSRWCEPPESSWSVEEFIKQERTQQA